MKKEGTISSPTVEILTLRNRKRTKTKQIEIDGCRLKNEPTTKKGRKKEFRPETIQNKVLENLVSLCDYITQELHFKNPRMMSTKLLLEITSFYLDIPMVERTNPKSGRTYYTHSKVSYNYVYALIYICLSL